MKPVTVIVETPKGSTCKFAYDQEQRRYTLKKVLPFGMAFPFDFGFLPGTSGEDGAPLDVIVIAEPGLFPGCAVSCRIIGVITANQKENSSKSPEVRNDRYISVAEESLLYSNIKSISQLPKKLLDELEAFFIQYNKLEGKKFTVIRRINADAAAALIKKNIEKLSGKKAK